MNKPNKLYRRWLESYRAKSTHRAWLYDTVEQPFDRKKFRFWFKWTRILYYSTLAILFVPTLIWSVVEPFWRKYDQAVDNFVGGWNRIPMALWGYNTLMAICITVLGCVHVHSFEWPFAIKIGIYFFALTICVLLSNVVYRCFERCAGNYCADMARWDND